MDAVAERLDDSDWLVEALASRVRGDTSAFDGLLVTVQQPLPIQDTRSTFRCHFIVRDANDQPRVDDLARMLAVQVVDYCIPRKRVEIAQRQDEKTGSTEQVLRLQTEAKELFSGLEKSGEGGELLLYLLLERVLGLPQLLCKMPHKTSSAMHVHGTDGIHGKVLQDGTLALYWGESKLYAKPAAAIRDCLESLAPFLTDTTGDTRRRDILLLRDNLDLADGLLTEALRRFFTEGRPESARVEFRGACLIGFSLEEYPQPTDAGVTSLVAGWLEKLANRVSELGLAGFEIELLCLPFPSVDDFRSSVKRRLGIA